MANNPKWTIPFMSLGGVECRADIYDTTGGDYTGEATVLIGQPQPVIFEEDTDDDLLIVVRTRTGYLNIIETADTSQAIEEMKPITNVSRKVKIWYDSELIFIGFMQAQSFENTWELPPRQMSFPIQSPLSLIADTDMPTYTPEGDSQHQGPRMVKLCELLDDAITTLNGMGAEYSKVVWPKMSVALSAEISSLVVCPFNSKHDQTVVSPSLYEEKNMQYILEGICNCFGWILHEAFDGSGAVLMFAKFDHTGEYYSCTSANLRTLTSVATETVTGDTQITGASYFTPADKDGKESILMPYEKVRLNYDGEVVIESIFNFDHLSYHSDIHSGNQYVAFLESNTPEITGYDNHLLLNNYFYNGKLTVAGVNPCICGTSVNLTECLLYNKPKNDSTCNNALLFVVRFYDRPTSNKFNLRFQMQWASILLEIGTDSNLSHPHVGVKIKTGNLWYHGQGIWNATEPNPYEYNSSSFEFYWADGLTNVPDGMPIEVYFYDTVIAHPPTDDYGQYLIINNIRLSTDEAVFSEQKRFETDTDDIRISNGYGQSIADIYLAFSAYRKNSNSLAVSMLPRSSWFTLYQYILYSRERITLNCKRSSSQQSYALYMGKLSFLNKVWRIISMNQNPYDDETEIIIQRSLES